MKRFGLLGEHLSHSFSPKLHSYIADYDYKLYPVPKGELEKFVAENELDGFNVTIPYKQEIIPYLSDISQRAERIGAVNTVIKDSSGKLHGYNTDYYGFRYLLGDDAQRLKGAKALVLGSGGASKTVQAVLADAGINNIVISRSGKDNYENVYSHQDAAIVVNATPVGMYPANGKSPLHLAKFRHLELVLDLIYNPLKTELILCAEDAGVPARNGLAMLSAQAVAAAELFLGRNFPKPLSGQLADKLTSNSMNIALIGMPGAGKTTVGRALAQKTGRKFIDVDTEIVNRIKMTIPEYFSKYGEAAFRKEETEVLTRAAMETGVVIATGGGVVTVPGNRRLLRQNSAVVLIERNIEDLPNAGRPVSQNRGIANIYRERKPLYEAWSDGMYFNADPDKTAESIMEDFA